MNPDCAHIAEASHWRVLTQAQPRRLQPPSRLRLSSLGGNQQGAISIS